MIKVVDRVAQVPGRVYLEPTGVENTFIMMRDDLPTVQGTPINAALFDSIEADIASAKTLIVDLTLDENGNVTGASHTFTQISEGISNGREVIVRYVVPGTSHTLYHRLMVRTNGSLVFLCVNPTNNIYLYGYSFLRVTSANAWTYALLPSVYRIDFTHNTNNTISSNAKYADIKAAYDMGVPLSIRREWYSGIQSYGLRDTTMSYQYNRNNGTFTFYFPTTSNTRVYSINNSNTWTIVQ